MHKNRKIRNVIKLRNVGAQTQKKCGPGGPLPEGWRPEGGRGRSVGAREGWGPEGGSCRVKPWPLGPPGFHTTARELQTCTFEGASNTTKIPREDPQREKKKKAKMVAGEGKKAQNFGRSGGRGSGAGGSRGGIEKKIIRTSKHNKNKHCAEIRKKKKTTEKVKKKTQNNTEQHRTTHNNTQQTHNQPTTNPPTKKPTNTICFFQFF